MKPRFLSAFVVFAAATSTAFALADGEEGPAKDVAELKVLANWVGTWDVEMTVKPNPNLPDNLQLKGEVTGRWVLGGRFVDQSGSASAGNGAPATRVTTMMTYDTRANTYKSWVFFSSGIVLATDGKWDAATRTMTSTGRDPESGVTARIKATFPEDGVERWSSIETDRDGKVIAETTGKNTRRGK
jgi:Protein of unknown function (DUF1579)